MDDDEDTKNPCEKKKPKKNPENEENEEEALKRMKDDEQAVLLNDPCPGACTIRTSRCCIVTSDPVKPQDCFKPFDYCSAETTVATPPPPPKTQCPTREEKKNCPAKKNKYLAAPETKPKSPEKDDK